MNLETFKPIIPEGIAVAFLSLGLAVSVSDVEQWLRIASLVIGCTVGLLAIFRRPKK